MVRKNIPISFVRYRNNRISSITEANRLISATYEQVLRSINDDCIDETSIVNEYIRDCSHPYFSNLYWESCMELLNKVSDQPYYDSIMKTIKKDIIPNLNSENIKKVENKVNGLEIPYEDAEELVNTAKDCIEADRVINNYGMISNRFNLDKYTKGFGDALDKSFIDIEELSESFAELIDTYSMPVRKKVAVALETAIYINESVGATDNTKIIKSILEYYLQANPIITDKDYASITKTLNTNRFIKDSDLSGVNYMFQNKDKLSFSQKILEATKNNEINDEYKELIIKISHCKSAGAVKGLVKAAFRLINATFVITASASFSMVTILLCSLFGLIVTVGASPSVVIGSINEEMKKCDNAIKALNGTKDQIKNHNKVYSLVKQLSTSIKEGDALNESAELVDSLIPSTGLDAPVLNDKIKDDGFAFMSINDICKSVNESKDYADSDDIKDLIKAYKADQDKNMPKLKKLINKIYTNKPANIIDEFPNVLGLIRKFCILSTAAVPVVGPGIALVTMCADYFIEMNLKREEAERVCKYFNSERSKMEKKLDKMKDGDKKDDLDDYIKCLDKCISKLEDYRDDLYTDRELDAKSALEEATLSTLNKLTLDEFINTKMASLKLSAMRAVQIIRNEVIRDVNNLTYTEYEYNGEVISNSLSKISPNEILSFYTTPDGIVDIPLGKISPVVVDTDGDTMKKLYLKSLEICENANIFIEKGFMVTSYLIDTKIIFTLNCLTCIDTRAHSDIMDHTMTETGLDIVSNILMNADIVEEMVECDPSTLTKDICSNAEVLVKEDCKELANIINNSGINCDEFVDTLKDYESYMDFATSSSIHNMIDALTDREHSSDNYSGITLHSIYQLESMKLLRAIVEEAKDDKENGNKNKGNLIDRAKDKVEDIKKKADSKDKEKVSLSTTAKLAAHNVANKAKDASSKEKEISRTIDAYSGTIAKSCKEALTSNRRESIIKGSVIPSFSKMIKAGIGIGAVGAIGGPVAAAITAVGALATSKYLTMKERQVLLEEIEVELEVIEKELERCDNAARHKQLLLYQRKLQRESQRIRYKIKIKGKDVPSPLD